MNIRPYLVGATSHAIKIGSVSSHSSSMRSRRRCLRPPEPAPLPGQGPVETERIDGIPHCSRGVLAWIAGADPVPCPVSAMPRIGYIKIRHAQPLVLVSRPDQLEKSQYIDALLVF